MNMILCTKIPLYSSDHGYKARKVQAIISFMSRLQRWYFERL